MPLGHQQPSPLVSPLSTARLGFIIDFMSHAAIVGFMAGAAVTISLSQLKGLLGYKTFTNNTDIVSVLTYVFQNTGLFNWRAFTIGIVFLVYLLTIKFLVRILSSCMTALSRRRVSLDLTEGTVDHW